MQEYGGEPARHRDEPDASVKTNAGVPNQAHLKEQLLMFDPKLDSLLEASFLNDRLGNDRRAAKN